MWGLVISLLVLFGCAPTSEAGEYYTGREGVSVEPIGDFPSKAYFYADSPADNKFILPVEIHNEGAAFSIGGIYVSGFNPSMYRVKGLDLLSGLTGNSGGCNVLLGSIIGHYAATLQCDFSDSGFRVGYDDGDIQFGFDGIFDWALNGIFDWVGDVLDSDLIGGIDVNVQGYFECTKKPDTTFAFDCDYEYLNIDFDNVSSLGALGDRGLLGIDYYKHYYAGVGFNVVDPTKGIPYELIGDTYYFPGGEYDFTDFEFTIHDWLPGLDEDEQTFMFTNCYLYATTATPTVCVDPIPHTEGKKVCRPGSQSLGSQGGPVAITRIEQENTPTKLIFTFYIENVGGGQIFNPYSLHKCNPYNPSRVTPADIDVVELGIVRLGGSWKPIKCTPNRLVRLQNGKGQVQCIYDVEFLGSKSAYESPLVIELWYGYEDTFTHNMKIRRIT